MVKKYMYVSSKLRKTVCVVCGKEFMAGSPSAKYCSVRCKGKAQKAGTQSKRTTNKPKPDIYCPVRKVSDALLGSPFSGGRRAVDAIQQTSTKVKKRGEI